MTLYLSFHHTSFFQYSEDVAECCQQCSFYLETVLVEALGFSPGECSVKQLSALLYTEVRHLQQPPAKEEERKTEIHLSLIIYPFILNYFYCTGKPGYMLIK